LTLFKYCKSCPRGVFRRGGGGGKII